MNEKVNILQEDFENERGERVPGITIIVDGQLRQIMDILIERNEQYQNYVDIVHTAFFAGIEQMMRNIPK